MAASERELATPVLDIASASILARPKSPTVETTSATITSMRLKPRARRQPDPRHRPAAACSFEVAQLHAGFPAPDFSVLTEPDAVMARQRV